MNLYLIQSVGDPQYVEANDYAEAIRIWQEWASCEWGMDDASQPESVALVHEYPVLRAKAQALAPELLAACESVADWLASFSVPATATNAERLAELDKLERVIAKAKGGA